jgi:hypothetical protein
MRQAVAVPLVAQGLHMAKPPHSPQSSLHVVQQ